MDYPARTSSQNYQLGKFIPAQKYPMNEYVKESGWDMPGSAYMQSGQDRDKGSGWLTSQAFNPPRRRSPGPFGR